MSENNLSRQIFTVGARARVWAFLRLNPENFYTLSEIAEQTDLSPSTVRRVMRFVSRAPMIEIRSRVERGSTERITRYGFVPFLQE